MTESLAHGYSSESSQRELSNEYQHDRVYSLAAKSKNVTFDGKICYKLPSMLNHIFIRWAIWYGWMAGFLLSFKVFLGQKMQKMN